MGTGPGRAGASPPLKPLEAPGRAVPGPEWRGRPRTGFRGLGRVLVERWPLSRGPQGSGEGSGTPGLSSRDRLGWGAREEPRVRRMLCICTYFGGKGGLVVEEGQMDTRPLHPGRPKNPPLGRPDSPCFHGHPRVAGDRQCRLQGWGARKAGSVTSPRNIPEGDGQRQCKEAGYPACRCSLSAGATKPFLSTPKAAAHSVNAGFPSSRPAAPLSFLRPVCIWPLGT